MNSTSTSTSTSIRSPIRSWPGRLARRIVAVVRECNDAQRRMTAISAAPDRYIARPDAAPDTYAEFLFRTSGPLLHEPSARSRARARGALR
jgi:hypothetical protein